MSAANVTAKHVLITGGGSGIGAASALVLASRGATVGVADLNSANAQAVVAQITATGGRAYALDVDVSSTDSVNRMFAAAVEQGGRVDVLLNNAGIDHAPTPLHMIDDATFERNLAVNLTGVFRCMRASLQHMLANGGGHIINIASVAGLRSAPTVGAYSAAKHGVVGLTRSAAVEYARMNIRINAVCPSFVDTPMVQGVLAHLDEKGQRKIVGANPMKRLGQPQEIANAIAWLCSDESSFMTGHTLTLDGGMLA